jgi:hypothetical protein
MLYNKYFIIIFSNIIIDLNHGVYTIVKHVKTEY